MNNGYFFVHSGERVELANAELRALVKSYHHNVALQSLDERVSIVDGNNIDFQKITSRTACTKYAGKLLNLSDTMDFDPDGHFKNYSKFACRLLNLSKKNVSMEPIRKLGKYIKE